MKFHNWYGINQNIDFFSLRGVLNMVGGQDTIHWSRGIMFSLNTRIGNLVTMIRICRCVRILLRCIRRNDFYNSRKMTQEVKKRVCSIPLFWRMSRIVKRQFSQFVRGGFQIRIGWLFDYLIFRFLTISMIIQYKPQTITISIKPSTKSPNPRGSHNIQTIDPPIKILCTIVVFRIISKNFILPPFSISILLCSGFSH